MESERPWPALIGHAPAGINHVESIGPRRVGALRRVAKLVEDRRNLNSELAHARSGNEFSFVFAARTGEDNFVFYIALHLPNIARVRLGDVDHKERDPASIFLVELVQGGNLPPEGRSGVAAEYKHNRTILGGESGELQRGGLVELGQREVRRGVTDL
jgi:hypothetical protein